MKNSEFLYERKNNATMSNLNQPAKSYYPFRKGNFFDKFSAKVTRAVGSTPAFTVACAVVLAWGISGPIFNFSETWQLVINTGTTIITFLMVFLIQKSQNKDSLAIQLKLNELIASHQFASNRLINIEDITEEELRTIHTFYEKLSEFARHEGSLHETHSLDEAEDRHSYKTQRRRERYKSVGKSSGK
jgi:low affinity Fe/Cu permease